MRFALEAKLGNDAMRSRLDVGNALVSLGDALRDQPGEFEPGDSGTFRDENGNTVGRWEVS